MTPEQVAALQRKTVRVLFTGQVMMGFGFGAAVTMGALLAESITGSAAFSGAGTTFVTLGSAVVAIPLARLASARGRATALAAGSTMAVLGAILVIWAAAVSSFLMLCAGIFLLGAAGASNLQARFAAADLPSGNRVGRSISIVVWATTIGAVTGPNLFAPGDAIGQALGLPHLTGPFLITIASQIVGTLVFQLGLRPDPLLTAQKLNGTDAGSRPKQGIRAGLAILRSNSTARYAVLSNALSHMVMVAVMSMTPVHMEHMGLTLVIVGFTISLHVAGMYAFSPIFGWLADKLGSVRVIILGQFVYLVALAFAGFGSQDRVSISIGLLLLGLGWSAATVSGAALLTTSLSKDEKVMVQGVSDSLMSFSGAIGGALSGVILAIAAYPGLNAAMLIPVAIVVIATAPRLVKKSS